MNADEQPPRKPANENSWYCLATLYGECTEGCDQNLHTRNRAAWNRWMAGELEDDKREELATLGFERSELIPLAGSELREFLAYFKSRTSLPLPEFKGIIDFSGVYFDHPLFFSQFVFPGFVKLNACQFDKFVHLHGCYMVGLDLTDAVFEEIFLCDAAIIRGTVSFMGAKFKKWCSAERLKFVSLANFSSIKCHDGFR